MHVLHSSLRSQLSLFVETFPFNAWPRGLSATKIWFFQQRRCRRPLIAVVVARDLTTVIRCRLVVPSRNDYILQVIPSLNLSTREGLRITLHLDAGVGGKKIIHIFCISQKIAQRRL